MKRLAEQRLGDRRPAAPVLLYHSTADEIIPFDGATALRARRCEVGADLTFWPVSTAGHGQTPGG